MPSVKSRCKGSATRTMQSLLARGKALLTPSGSTTNLAGENGFRTAQAATTLFAGVDPAVDGEDCLRDCASCTAVYPRKFEIDEEDELYGHVKGWDTHLVVATGKTDWVRDVTDEKGSVMQAAGRSGLEVANGKVMLSASDMPMRDEHGEWDDELGTRCLLLPSWKLAEGVKTKDVPRLLKEVLAVGPTNVTLMALPGDEDRARNNGELQASADTEEEEQRQQTSIPDHGGHQAAGLHIGETNGSIAEHPVPARAPTTPLPFSLKQCPHRAVILMCSQKTRDARCGMSAPILRKELERHLRPLGLYRDLHDDRPGGVGIYFISHVGGHKYSANVMVYRREGQQKTGNEKNDRASLSQEAVQGIWLARVRPEDCENIVKYTVLQGKVVKPARQLRGGFDRERGVISW